MNPIKIAAQESDHLIIPIFEDTYVQNGEGGKPNNCIDKSFGDRETLNVKGDEGTGSLHRMILLKFDVSSLQNCEVFSADIILYSWMSMSLTACP